MADARRGEIFPFPYIGGYGGYSFASMTLDAATDQLEFVWQAEASDTITGALIRQATETGDDTSVYRVSLQSVDASGNPTGTILGATSNGYGDYTATTAKDNSIQRVTFAEGVSITQGTWYALVIRYQSGTALSAGVQQCAFSAGLSHSTVVGRAPVSAYWINNNAGSRSRQSGSAPLFGLTSSTMVYGNPIETVTHLQYRANTAGADEYGVQFSIPAAWCDTYKLAGVYAYVNMPAGTTVDVTLWSNASPPVSLATINVDSDVNVASDSYWQRFLFSTSPLPTLTAGTTYNITLFNNSAASNMSLREISVDQADDFKALPWGDITMYEARRLDAASSFTTSTTDRPCIGLILADITEPSGSSGGGIVIGG